MNNIIGYRVFYRYLDYIWKTEEHDWLGGMLGGMSWLVDGSTADPAYESDWDNAVEKTIDSENTYHVGIQFLKDYLEIGYIEEIEFKDNKFDHLTVVFDIGRVEYTEDELPAVEEDAPEAEAYSEEAPADFEEEYEEFTPEAAEKIMKLASTSASQWHISPLQDFLFMEEKYWLENADDERINIPGTVTAFNWTYRIPVSIEDLMKNKKLIEKINNVSKR